VLFSFVWNEPLALPTGGDRPCNQVDLVVDTRADQVDPGFVPGARATFPQSRFNHSDFWAQGLTFGLELSF
jgi:hypothetical protein